MQKIVVNINPSIKEHIMFFLQNLPKNLVDIEVKKIEPSNKNYSNNKAFGILKDKIKDPIKWQEEIRKDSDRDVYKGIVL